MKFISIIIILSFTLPLNGQNTSKTDTTKPKFGLLKKLSFNCFIGPSFIQLPDLNARLNSLGTDKVSTATGTFGIGVSLGKKKAFGGIEFTYLTRYNGSEVSFFFNHVLFDNNTLSIAPGIDFGSRILTLHYQRQNASMNFDTLFVTSGNEVRLDNNAIFLGVSAIVKLKKLESKNLSLFRIFQSLRIGYKYGDKNVWKFKDTPLLNAPSDRLSSFYIQIYMRIS